MAIALPDADAERMEKRITEEIPMRVSADQAYRNAKQNSDRQNARIEHDMCGVLRSM